MFAFVCVSDSPFAADTASCALHEAYAELEQENKDLEEQNIQLRVRSGVLADRVDTLESDLQGFEFEKANLMKFVTETVGQERAAQIARGV